MDTNSIGIKNKKHDKIIFDGEINNKKIPKESSIFQSKEKRTLIIRYYLITLFIIYVVRYMSFKNEYNYLVSTKKSVTSYILRRLICGKYCIKGPIMDTNSIYHKIDIRLFIYLILITILYIFIIPIALPHLYYTHKIENPRNKKKHLRYNKKLWKKFKYLTYFLLLILTMFVFTIDIST